MNEEKRKINIAVVVEKKPSMIIPTIASLSKVYTHINLHHPHSFSSIGGFNLNYPPNYNQNLKKTTPSSQLDFFPKCNNKDDSIHNDQNKDMKKNGEKIILCNFIRNEDVICGRGAGSKTNIGNVKFRSLVSGYKQAYLSSKPLEKINISKVIVSIMINNGSRFIKLAEPKNSNLWQVMDEKAARVKTSQALRERNAISEPYTPKEENNPTYIPKGFNKGMCTTLNRSDASVNDQDVLLGRGGVTNTHVGNMNYRSMVHELQDEYHSAAKLKKADVALRVVERVYNQGGKFLHESEGKWVEVSKERARKKTSQLMREKSTNLRMKSPSSITR